MDCRTTLVSVRHSPSHACSGSGRLADRPLPNGAARWAQPLPLQLTYRECEFRTDRAPWRGIVGGVTAPPGAPNDRSGDKVATTEEPSTAAFGLLSRAQDLADHLRSDVEAEVAAMRAEASAAHDEARRALIDAPNVHQDAISAQRSAQARLREAQDEAAQLVADAADQATLVADAANLTTESLLASTQVEADEIRGAAMAEDLRLRGLATTELERTREKNAVLLSKAAEIESRQLRASAELRQVDQEATERATSIRAAAEDFLTMAISRAAAEASATHAITVQEIEQARSETAVLRSTAAAEIASARDAAAGEAHRVLCDAADHMNWTQDTVVSLLSTAKAEADRLRHADHQRSSIHLAARRRQLQDVISRVALRVRTAIAEGAAEAERLRAQANAILEAADKDAVATRDHALAHAERVITEADLTVHAALERGQRRLDEAEIGASVLRQRAAERCLGSSAKPTSIAGPSATRQRRPWRRPGPTPTPSGPRPATCSPMRAQK